MKLFENGIEIDEKEFLLEPKGILEDWIIHMINQRILGHKEAFKIRWFKELEADQEVRAYPKDIDECIKLIKSRPWFKTEKQIQEEFARKSKLTQSANNFQID